MRWKKLGHIGFLIMLFLMTGNSYLYACNTPPSADFSVDNAAPVTGEKIKFTDASNKNDGSISSWAWDFGSGAVSATANTNDPDSVYYTSTGTKTVSLTITYPANGLFGYSAGSNSTTKTVTVSCNNPTAAISPDPASVEYGNTLSVNGNPSGGSGTYSTHAWTGTGAAYLSATDIHNPVFSGAPAGNYTLTYTVTDSYGCEGTDDFTVTVTKKQLTFTAGDQTVTYGTNKGTITQNGTYTISGFVNGDNSSVVTDLGSVSYETNYTSATNTGTSGITITPDLTGLSSANYDLVTASGDITITKADQHIVFDCVPFTKPLNEFDTMPIRATASSGLPITVTILAGSAATLNGSPGNYYLTNIGTTGTVTLYVDQAGNDNYNAAAQAIRFFDVTKSNQNISFPNIDDVGYYNGLSLALNATVTSELPVSYSVISGPATVSGNTLNITGAGEVKVMASQPGDASFNAAPNILNTFNVLKGTQTITINVQAGALSTSTQITATSTSGLPVALTLGTGSAASGLIYNSGGGYYTLTGIGGSGNIYIAGNQAGNANYQQAAQLVQTIVIGKTNQTINFSSIGNKTYGDSPFSLIATATSELPVSYSILSGPASLSGSTLTITGAGTVVVAANQAGNAAYNPAPTVTQQFEVDKATPVINQLDITTTFGDAAITISPTSSSTGTYSFLSGNDDIFTLSENTATSVGAGTTTLYITQQPTTNYFGATKTVNFNVNKAPSTITITGVTEYTYNAMPQGPETSDVTGSNGSVSYSYSGTGYGPSPTMPLNTGTYSVTATVAADDNYNGATSEPYSFAISKAEPTITVTPYTVTYDGTLHTSIGSATGVSLENLAGLDLSGTNHSDAGTYTDDWTFTDETGNYNDATGSVVNIINKMPVTITLNDTAKCFGAEITPDGTEFTLNKDLVGGNKFNTVRIYCDGFQPGAVAGTYEIYSTGITSCTGNPDNYDITWVSGQLTVKPLPTLDGASQEETVCAGYGAVINLTGLLPGKVFSLDYSVNGVDQSSITVSSDGSGNSSFTTTALTASNNGQILQIKELTITSETPNCTQSFTENVTLNVNPLPTLSSVGQDGVACDGSPAVIKLTGLLTNTTFSLAYTINEGDTIAVENITADVSGNASFSTPELSSANNGQTLQILGILITGEEPNCGQLFTDKEVVLEVAANPTATITGDAAICHGESVALFGYSDATGDKYDINFDAAAQNQGFSNVSGTTLSGSAIEITVPESAQPGTYNAELTLTDSATGCISEVYNIAITIYPLPATGEIIPD